MQLQHYYNVMSEKVSKEVAQIVVWEGAVKNRKIKAGLSDLVDEDCELVCYTSCSTLRVSMMAFDFELL